MTGDGSAVGQAINWRVGLPACLAINSDVVAEFNRDVDRDIYWPIDEAVDQSVLLSHVHPVVVEVSR